MFRLISCIAIVVLAMLCSNVDIQAAGTPCMPDCFSDPYGPPKTKIFEISPGCFVRVTYHERFACNQFHDVAIVQIDILSPFTCNFYNTAQFLEIVSRRLVAFVPAALPHDSCESRFRITRGSCWRSDTTNACGDTIMVPCLTPGCCMIEYEVCGDSVTGNSARPIAITSPVMCVPSDSSPCRPACDTSIAYGLRGTTNVTDETTQSQQLTIAPNPAAQSVRIAAPRSTLTLCDRIAIVDLHGRRVTDVAISEAQRQLGFVDVDISALSTGVYLVTCSGSQVNLSSQFSIQR